ncbi:MAG: DUF2946 domain-containing protein [Caulobacteraceae bacterium]
MASPRQAKRFRTPIWATILAVLALATELLIPAAAAQAHVTGPQIVICTLQGAKTVSLDHQDHDGGFAGLKCHQCVAASLASVTEEPPALAVRVTYATPASLTPRADAGPPLGARAPPRPLGQGPPDLSNV